MKRTKLFLGITTCVLAVAGVAATKAARFAATITSYYCTVGKASCVTLTVPSCAPGITPKCTIIIGQFPNQHHYTVYNFQTSASNGCATSTARCAVKLAMVVE